VRVLRVLAVLTVGAAGSLAAQLAAPQPTEKLLILPLTVTTPADSAASIAATDAARERLIQLARYKVNAIPKAKICDVLAQSGFSCDALMSDQQASQLARALSINSFTSGVLTHAGNQYGAKMRITSGASGFASSFTVSGAATPAALGEAIAQRMATIVKASEFARSCNDQRSHNAPDRALAEARKAFAIEPNLAAANLCIATVFEVQHAPPDSLIAAFRRARKGDPANSEAWSREAQVLLVKGDTVGALATFDSLLSYNPADKNLRLALATQMLQHKSFTDAERLVSDGLKFTPGDQQLLDERKRICLEGVGNAPDAAVVAAMSQCLLQILRQEADADTTKLADTNNLKLAIGTAQKISDTTAYLWWARSAVRRYPTSVAFIKQEAGAYLLAGQMDSALAYYQKALAQNPNDVQTSLLIAKTIVDNAVWDTAKAGPCQRNKDTVCLRVMRDAFVPKVDPARPYLSVGYASPDSGLRLTTAVVGLSGGSKLAQAGAYDAAFTWLDQLLTQLAPHSSTDTTGAKQQIRIQASFWFGLSTALSLGPFYGQMVKEKSCDQAKSVNDRIARGVQAIDLGGRVAPTVAAQMRGILMQYQVNMPKVKQAFKCKNF
jgi:tetratricopeptide (TPR) repeat protein